MKLRPASFAFLVVASQLMAQEQQRLSLPPTLQSSTIASYQVLNINAFNFVFWYREDGQSGHTPDGNPGILYPGTMVPVAYQDGLLWAGKAFLDPAMTQPAPPHTIRVGGQTYWVGTQEGWINGFGPTATPADRNDPRVRIYRIRRDYAVMSYGEATLDAAIVFQIPQEQVEYAQHIRPLLDQYARDWNEWPVERGAPYIERNGTPGYQPPPPGWTPSSLIDDNYDEPGIAGANPSSPADQVIFAVFNDLDIVTTSNLYGSYPLGLEAQMTLWAYKRSDGLGHIVFQRLRLINKGGVDIGGGNRAALYIDSMFIAKWVDSDLGNFADDLLGCDTARAMAYTYNSSSVDREYQKFNLPPPAIGWSLLQGPVVPGGANDSAIFDFRIIRGKKNLSMTSFSPQGAGTGYGDPPSSFYEGTLRWWRWIQGYLPTPSSTPWRMYDFPPGMTPSFFPLSGDPVTRAGFIDGLGTVYSLPPGSRRFAMNSGPFRLAPGDTQEVVIAMIGGMGADHLTSIGALRFNYRYARQLQRLRFASPGRPPSPDVRAIALDREIILEWGSNRERVRQTEQTTLPSGHRFEGYVVYQLPSHNASLSEGKKIATFDVLNGIRNVIDERFDPQTGLVVPYLAQSGTDSGVVRYLRVVTNALAREGEDRRLFNGQEYVFAVTAYTYSPDLQAIPRSLESDPAIVRVRPQVPFGQRLSAAFGDTMHTQHLSGRSDGKVLPILIDPLSATGDVYQVGFETAGDSLTWYVHNVSRNRRVLSGQSFSQIDYPIIEGGIHLRVLNTPLGLKREDMFDTNDTTRWGWKVTRGTRRFTWVNAGGLGFEGFRGAAGWASPNTVFGAGTPFYSAAELKAVEIRLANATPTSPPGRIPSVTFDPNQANVSYAYRYGRTFNSPPARPEFAPYIINPSGGYAYQDFTKSVPLAVYDIDANPPRRLAIGFLENNVAGGMVDGKYFPPDNTIDNTAATGPREWLFIFGTDYSETPNPAFQVEAINNRLPIMYFITWNRRGDVPFTDQDRIALYPYHPLNVADIYQYRSIAPERSNELSKASAERVGVFPNPYYAGQTEGPFRQGRFVTFSNLPPKATIRIVNLAGHVVRKLDKNDPSQYYEWDLRNKDGLLVASGMYVCYVEMPEVGVTKILKVAIIQDEVLPGVQ